MIITSSLKITVYNKNINYYKELGFILKPNDIIDIDVSMLPKYSRHEIEVECDYCGNRKMIQNKVYNKITSNSVNKYFCKKCKINKTKQTNLERYGVENVFQLDDVKNKSKQTLINKYGVDHPLKSKEIQYKSKTTLFNNYGVNYPLQSEELKNKAKETNLERYGFKYPMQNKEIQNKCILTNLKIYQTEYALQNSDIIDKL